MAIVSSYICLDVNCTICSHKSSAQLGRRGGGVVSSYRQLRAIRVLLQLKESVEIQKGAIAIDFVHKFSALLVLNGTSLSCNNALLALN